MVKDGIVEETVEEMTLTITPDSDDDSEDEDLIDEDDRQIIDRALERLTGVSIHWTGLLDWNTGLDYWTDL